MVLSKSILLVNNMNVNMFYLITGESHSIESYTYKALSKSTCTKESKT